MSDIAKSSGGTATAKAFSVETLEALLRDKAGTESFLAEISRLFYVQPTEIALLRLEHGFLRFIHPQELQTSGTIPLSSSSSIAAHTAASQRTELFNNFTKIKHIRIFETVKLPTAEKCEPVQQPLIQKLISAPIQSEDGKVRGVIQICRKGLDVAEAGPDFSMDDVHRLEATTKVLAKAAFIHS